MKNIMAGHGTPHARIEIVPLIDIMFFLLASFMLVSLTMSKQQTIKVDLPSAVAARQEFKPEIINLAVDRSGSYFLEKQRITMPDLQKELTRRIQANTNLPVYISGDLETSHGAMVGLLDLVRGSGFQRVAFNVKAGQAGK
ncbi:MAG: ExbD/TolR family protein [Limisphaerales bacterium]|jgi:biopolymer transport protein ExbD